MPVTPDHEWFDGQLRLALNSLYNPSLLRKNPLLALLGLGEKRNGALALQETLLAAIESLRPPASAPAQSDMWRYYQVLRRRYTEQVPQAQVANDLALSIRQLQRTESQARAELAAALWEASGLENRVASFRAELDKPPDTELSVEPSVEQGAEDEPDARQVRRQELDYLSRSLPVQVTDLRQMIDTTLDTVAPLAASAQVEVTSSVAEDAPPLLVQEPLLQQAVVNLACFAVYCSPGGRVHVSTRTGGGQVLIEVTGSGIGPASAAACATSEQVETARHLAQLCGGALAFSFADEANATAAAGWAVLSLPSLELVNILAIDDNLDTQQLYTRYLAGSRYRLLNAATAADGMVLALEAKPRAILLDIMMPQRDGWTLLGQLREHPDTHAIPVIVCSILPQEQLALVLGAAAFLRKPVSRADLLRALAQLLESQNPAAGP